jgi:carboxymethylenebutenolidase
LNTAKLFPDELDAAVIYYGHVTDDEEALRPINTPILGHFGMEDRGIPVDDVDRFERALEHLRKDYTIHYYEGAGHAFANPTGQRYNAEAAEVAWQRTLEFLNQRLTAGSDEESS